MLFTDYEFIASLTHIYTIPQRLISLSLSFCLTFTHTHESINYGTVEVILNSKKWFEYFKCLTEL